MRFGTALGLSIAAHAILAAGIVGIVKWNPGPKVIAQLDLSSVELSFAEEEREEAPAVPMPGSTPGPWWPASGWMWPKARRKFGTI